jgi:hypothetical protein
VRRSLRAPSSLAHLFERAGHRLFRDVLWDDDDPVDLGKDNIARVDNDPGDLNRTSSADNGATSGDIDRTRSARVDGKAQVEHHAGIAVAAVGQEPARSPSFGGVREELAPDRDIRHPADAADDDVTRLQSINRGDLIRVWLVDDFVLRSDQHGRGASDEDLAGIRLRRRHTGLQHLIAETHAVENVGEYGHVEFLGHCVEFSITERHQP